VFVSNGLRPARLLLLLGNGARLFDNLRDAEVQLEQVRAVEAPGVTHLKYRSVNEAGRRAAGNRARVTLGSRAMQKRAFDCRVSLEGGVPLAR
jgi:hypothetical protein